MDMTFHSMRCFVSRVSWEKYVACGWSACFGQDSVWGLLCISLAIEYVVCHSIFLSMHRLSLGTCKVDIWSECGHSLERCLVSTISIWPNLAVLNQDWAEVEPELVSKLGVRWWCKLSHLSLSKSLNSILHVICISTQTLFFWSQQGFSLDFNSIVIQDLKSRSDPGLNLNLNLNFESTSWTLKSNQSTMEWRTAISLQHIKTPLTVIPYPSLSRDLSMWVRCSHMAVNVTHMCTPPKYAAHIAGDGRPKPKLTLSAAVFRRLQ